MSSFITFAENTKDVCLYITSGLLVIALASFTKNMIGNITSKLIKLIGILILASSFFVFSKELLNFIKDKPDFLFNQKYSSFKKNTLMSCGLCVLLLVTILYATYSLLF